MQRQDARVAHLQLNAQRTISTSSVRIDVVSTSELAITTRRADEVRELAALGPDDDDDDDCNVTSTSAAAVGDDEPAAARRGVEGAEGVEGVTVGWCFAM